MRLPFVPVDGCCRQCGRDVPGLDGEYLCEDCRTYRPHFDRCASVFRFDGDARQMVLDFKFNRHFWLREDLVDGLESMIRVRFKSDEIDLVVPVPATLGHRLDRGFNPPGLLASALAKRLVKPFSGWTLRRIGHPARQGGLSAEDRRKNVIGTFAVRLPGKVRGRTVLVIDDVMTTGFTLSECARILKAAGANRVWCATVSRSIRV